MTERDPRSLSRAHHDVDHGCHQDLLQTALWVTQLPRHFLCFIDAATFLAEKLLTQHSVDCCHEKIRRVVFPGTGSTRRFPSNSLLHPQKSRQKMSARSRPCLDFKPLAALLSDRTIQFCLMHQSHSTLCNPNPAAQPRTTPYHSEPPLDNANVDWKLFARRTQCLSSIVKTVVLRHVSAQPA